LCCDAEPGEVPGIKNCVEIELKYETIFLDIVSTSLPAKELENETRKFIHLFFVCKHKQNEINTIHKVSRKQRYSVTDR
jgi:hypothetical protein